MSFAPLSVRSVLSLAALALAASPLPANPYYLSIAADEGRCLAVSTGGRGAWTCLPENERQLVDLKGNLALKVVDRQRQELKQGEEARLLLWDDQKRLVGEGRFRIGAKNWEWNWAFGRKHFQGLLFGLQRSHAKVTLHRANLQVLLGSLIHLPPEEATLTAPAQGWGMTVKDPWKEDGRLCSHPMDEGKDWAPGPSGFPVAEARQGLQWAQDGLKPVPGPPTTWVWPLTGARRIPVPLGAFGYAIQVIPLDGAPEVELEGFTEEGHLKPRPLGPRELLPIARGTVYYLRFRQGPARPGETFKVGLVVISRGGEGLTSQKLVLPVTRHGAMIMDREELAAFRSACKDHHTFLAWGAARPGQPVKESSPANPSVCQVPDATGFLALGSGQGARGPLDSAQAQPSVQAQSHTAGTLPPESAAPDGAMDLGS